jgi:hypothetical protein
MKKKRPQRSGSWLTRFFKSEDDGKRRTKTRPQRRQASKTEQNQPAQQAPELSRRQKDVAEIKHLAAIGRKDPERLALLLTNMLGEARQRQQRDEEKFRTLIEELASREQRPD